MAKQNFSFFSYQSHEAINNDQIYYNMIPGYLWQPQTFMSLRDRWTHTTAEMMAGQEKLQYFNISLFQLQTQCETHFPLRNTKTRYCGDFTM